MNSHDFRHADEDYEAPTSPIKMMVVEPQQPCAFGSERSRFTRLIAMLFAAHLLEEEGEEEAAERIWEQPP
jgi:hypothetical protein